MTGEPYYLKPQRRDNLTASEIAEAFIPGYGRTVKDVQQGVENAKETLAFIENNKFKILFGVFCAMVLANVIAIKLTR